MLSFVFSMNQSVVRISPRLHSSHESCENGKIFSQGLETPKASLVTNNETLKFHKLVIDIFTEMIVAITIRQWPRRFPEFGPTKQLRKQGLRQRNPLLS
jgi:hypothetical protein